MPEQRGGLPELIILDVGGTLGESTAPTVSSRLIELSPLPEEDVKKIIQDVLLVAHHGELPPPNELCAKLDIDPARWPIECITAPFEIYPALSPPSPSWPRSRPSLPCRTHRPGTPITTRPWPPPAHLTSPPCTPHTDSASQLNLIPRHSISSPPATTCPWNASSPSATGGQLTSSRHSMPTLAPSSGPHKSHMTLPNPS